MFGYIKVCHISFRFSSSKWQTWPCEGTKRGSMTLSFKQNFTMECAHCC